MERSMSFGNLEPFTELMTNPAEVPEITNPESFPMPDPMANPISGVNVETLASDNAPEDDALLKKPPMDVNQGVEEDVNAQCECYDLMSKEIKLTLSNLQLEKMLNEIYERCVEDFGKGIISKIRTGALSVAGTLFLTMLTSSFEDISIRNTVLVSGEFIEPLAFGALILSAFVGFVFLFIEASMNKKRKEDNRTVAVREKLSEALAPINNDVPKGESWIGQISESQHEHKRKSKNVQPSQIYEETEFAV